MGKKHGNFGKRWRGKMRRGCTIGLVALLGVSLLVTAQVPQVAEAASYQDLEGLDAKTVQSIEAMTQAGILEGYEGGTAFRPHDSLKRAQAAKVIAEAMGWAPDPGRGAFPDVTIAEDKGYIGALVGHGVVKGYTNGNFGPYDELTRQQLVTMSVRALGLEETSVTLYEQGITEIHFADEGEIAADGTQRANVALAAALGFLSDPPGDFEPTRYASRATMALFGYQLYAAQSRTQYANMALTLRSLPASRSGLTNGPDLVQVNVAGAEVTYTFDEAVAQVDGRGSGFFLVPAAGLNSSSQVIAPQSVSIDPQNPLRVVANYGDVSVTALASLAGVKNGAARDGSGNMGPEGLLPLQAVALNGQSLAPNLVDVDIESFDEEDIEGEDDDDDAEVISADFIFDRLLDEGSSPDEEDFILIFHDGTILRGDDIDEIHGNTVTVDMDLEDLEDSDVEEDDDAVRAAVNAGAVQAEGAGALSNPVGVLLLDNDGDVEDVADLDEVSVDTESHTITLVFDEDVDDFFDEGDEDLDKFALIQLDGRMLVLDDRTYEDTEIDELDNEEVVIKLERGLLQSAVGIAIIPDDIFEDLDALEEDEEDNGYSVGVLPLNRTFASGESESPVLQAVQTAYQPGTGELVVTYAFDQELQGDQADPKKFKLYSEEGQVYTAKTARINGTRVDAAFEMSEAVRNELAVAAVIEGAVSGQGSGLISPAASQPLGRN